MDEESLKEVLNSLHAPSNLDDHPLTQARFVQDYRQSIPDGMALPYGQALVQALTCIWDEHFRPGALSSVSSKTKVNRFLVLQVGYFEPALLARRSPLSLDELSARLCDEDYLKELFSRLGVGITPDGEDFIREEIIEGRTAFADSTLRGRIKAALTELVEKLQSIEHTLERSQAPLSPPDLQRKRPKASEVLSLYLDDLRVRTRQSCPPRLESILEYTSNLEKALLIGEPGSGKWSLLSSLEERLTAAWQDDASEALLPITINLVEYAPLAQEMDLIGYAAQHVFGRLHRGDQERKDFEQAVGELEADGRVVWLLGTWDALADEAMKVVLPRVSGSRRFVITTRAWRPPFSCGVEVLLPEASLLDAAAFVPQQLNTTPGLKPTLLKGLGELAQELYGWDATPKEVTLTFHESDLSLQWRHRYGYDYMEQGRRAGFVLYDGDQYRLQPAVAAHLAAEATIDQDSYQRLAYLGLFAHRRPVLRQTVKLLAHRQKWASLENLSWQILGLTEEALNLRLLLVADLLAEIESPSSSKPLTSLVGKVSNSLQEWVAIPDCPELAQAAAERLERLGRPRSSWVPAPHIPTLSPDTPTKWEVAGLLQQLGEDRLASRVLNGLDWRKEGAVLSRLAEALIEPHVQPEFVATCLYHADLMVKGTEFHISPLRLHMGKARVYEQLAEIALGKLQSHLRPLILAILAKPEYLLWLSENEKYRPLVGSLALHLDAFLMTPKYGSPYVIAGDRLHRLQKRGARR